MAIKPDDCVIRIESLAVGTKEIRDWDGRLREVTLYEKYWENFLDHVGNNAKKFKPANWKVNPYDVVFAEELAKYKATYKVTKKWSERYIKFRSHKDLMLFILRWS